MKNELITIIVPIYKVEKYIKKCIESVLNQTYNNLEIILVDDGSTDNCGEICEKYAKNDNRIKVIHKENGGLSDARNTAIDVAKGKYIFLLDGDDSIVKRAIEHLYGLIQKYNADIAIGKVREVLESDYNDIEKKDEELYNNKDVKIYKNKDALETMLYNTEFTNMACNKLYKKELFSGIRYPVGKLYEDLGTTYKIISKAKNTVVTPEVTYHYLVHREGSIMNKEYTSERMQALKFTEEILEFVKKEYIEIEDAAISRLYMECIFILLKLPRKKIYKEDNEKVIKYLREYRYKVIKNKRMPIKQKLLCIASIGGRISLRFVWNVKEFLKKAK